MSTGKGKGKVIGVELDTEKVENLIKQCKIFNLNPKEIMDVLYEQQKIVCFLTQTTTEKMSTEKDKGKVTPVEVEIEVEEVKNFIEQCMIQNLNPKVVIDVLDEQLKIACSFTNIMWPELEKQNREFFENYYSRLIMKELHKIQAEMVIQSDKSPINFDGGASSSLVEKMSTSGEEEMQMVKNMIEQCLVHFMNQKQVIDILYEKESIEPSLTKTVWQHLVEQNQEFFKHYYLRLAVKGQTIKLNNLVEQQIAMMHHQLSHSNEVAAILNHKFNVTATTLEIDRHRPGILGLQLQVITPPLQSAPPATNSQLSGSG